MLELLNEAWVGLLVSLTYHTALQGIIVVTYRQQEFLIIVLKTRAVSNVLDYEILVHGYTVLLILLQH